MSIPLGFEVGTGLPVEIPLRHTAVTGQTQESGKTTTLEGLIARSGLTAVAYVTKRGESSFHVMNPIPPYFQERADWKFVQSLLEASTETKLKFEQSWIMRASEGAKKLEDVRNNINRFLSGVKDLRPVKKRRGAEVKERWIQRPARGLSGDVYYVLNKYLDDIMPQLAELPYSTELELAPGLNVMDLRDYEFPLQSLVVRSVLDWTRLHGKDTINLIPEAWKFAPKQKGSPVRQSAEELIREGGALKNFLWIDSQDLAGVADVLMRQVGVWLFGVQRAKHEIERALDHMPEGLPARRPRPADIATLSKGQFYVCFGREMYKVYVQPAWMSAAHAEAIARGEEDVESAREILTDYDRGKHGTSTKAALAAANKRAKTRGGLPEDKNLPVSRLQSAQDSTVEPGGSAFDRDTFGGDDPTKTKEYPEDVKAAGNHYLLAQSDGTWICDACKKPYVDRYVAAANPCEEAMWKEKYEELKIHFDQALAELTRLQKLYPKAIAGGGFNGEPKSTLLNEQDYQAIYAFVKNRASKDPGILQILSQQPELRIKIERKTIDVDQATLRGRLAILLSRKFFDAPQNGNTAFNELKRLGFPCAKPNVYRELDKLAELGFVTKEDAGYQAVPGMKVNIL